MRVHFIYSIILCFIFQQCAKQTAPTGGPIDETSPRLKASIPRHEQTNVKSGKIELIFDEAIQLNNPREEIIITPSVGKKFEIISNKNKVELDLKTELQENTTYSINFREAIQDMTEKNPAYAKLAFSTGSYIDSLRVTGRVYDALTETIAPNYTVALAEASDTFNIFKHPASWLTLTDKQGKFSLENLKPGNYTIYAFDDKSNNLVVDTKTERYGFLAKLIQLTQNIDSLKIRTFKLDNNKLKLISGRTTFAYYNLKFSKSLVNYTVDATDTTRKIYSNLEPDLSTIKLYNTLTDLDSLQIRVRATDSLNYKIDTLLYMKLPKKESTRDKFVMKNEGAFLQESNSILSTKYTFSKPITTFTSDSIYIEIDSLMRIPFTKEDYQWNNYNTSLSLTKKVNLTTFAPKDTSSTKSSSKPSTKKDPGIVSKRGTFISIEKDSSVISNIPIKIIRAEATAILEVKIETSENFIVHLLTKNGLIIRESFNQKDIRFENLPPDTYQLRLVIDLNKNGKWDAGDFLTKAEPEPVIYYRNPKNSKEISLKANWHLGPLLITY